MAESHRAQLSVVAAAVFECCLSEHIFSFSPSSEKGRPPNKANAFSLSHDLFVPTCKKKGKLNQNPSLSVIWEDFLQISGTLTHVSLYLYEIRKSKEL